MTESMVWRVAEGQAKFDGRSLMGMPRGERERYLERARIAIEEMRTVPEGISNTAMGRPASRATTGMREMMEGYWSAVIDAILNEQVSK